ncbi:hypothetical protein [Rhabdochromatium marinum]|uniref:hypothetical protein n=1 Tax=Rhabdochromatium marinum TaxID=48729 RepID=UPI001905CB87|nr:hypothetical protein [Rhabdochromatium marinum]MBK1650553.1 hypothetical protein [Rhabdochromatium marinum]
MDPLHDPEIVSLPHPIRVDMTSGEEVDVGLLRSLGLHVCEGTYVGCYAVPPFDPMHDRLGRCQALGLDPARPTRVLEIVIIGSPEGKANALDDASQDIVLMFQDEDESLNAVLDRHIQFFCSSAGRALPGLKEVTREELDSSLIKNAR